MIINKYCDDSRINGELTEDESKQKWNTQLTRTCESEPPVAKRQKISFEFSLIVVCISTLRTGSRLCHDISGIVHFMVFIGDLLNWMDKDNREWF